MSHFFDQKPDHLLYLYSRLSVHYTHQMSVVYLHFCSNLLYAVEADKAMSLLQFVSHGTK